MKRLTHILVLLLTLLSGIQASAGYDPSIQRWIQRDPIGERGGLNLYEFVGNDPVNKTDPNGLQVPPQAIEAAAQMSEAVEPLEAEVEAEAEKAWDAFAQQFSELVQKARDKYPKLCDKFQWHHPVPQYLGGKPDQPLVLLEAPYHQMITTAFRSQYGYGQGAPADPTTVVNIVNIVYSQLPLPK